MAKPPALMSQPFASSHKDEHDPERGGAYTLSDRGTWLSYGNKAGMKIVVEGDRRLLNLYDVILLNPQTHPHAKQAPAHRLADWLASPEGQMAIASYEGRTEALSSRSRSEAMSLRPRPVSYNFRWLLSGFGVVDRLI